MNPQFIKSISEFIQVPKLIYFTLLKKIVMKNKFNEDKKQKNKIDIDKYDAPFRPKNKPNKLRYKNVKSGKKIVKITILKRNFITINLLYIQNFFIFLSLNNFIKFFTAIFRSSFYSIKYTF